MRIFDLPGESSAPDAMQFAPDGRLLAIQSHGRVHVLDTTTGTSRPIYPDGRGKTGTAGVGFTADSSSVVYFREYPGRVHIFDLETGQERILQGGNKVAWSSRGDIEICATQADGKLVFLAENPAERTVEIVALDPVSGERKVAFGRHRSYIRELAISRDGKWVAAASAHDLRVWGIGGPRLPRRANWHVEDRKAQCFGNLALSQDGTYLAVGGYAGHGRVRVWNVQAGEELDLESSLGRLSGGGVAFAPDRPLLAFTQRREDTGVVIFWDAVARAEVKRFDWQLGGIEAIAFAPDGCRCATGSQSKVVIWDVDV